MIKKLVPTSIILFSCLYIFIIPNEPHSIKLVFKLIPMLLIIYYAFRNIPYLSKRTHYLILTGLIFSTIGDGTLHWFVIGLSAFLVGHLFYISAFVRELSITLPRLASLLILLPYGLWIGTALVQHLQLNNEQSVILPVILYILAILVMGFTAILTGNIYAILGSMLFIISDSILAWNKFITTVDYSDIFIMSTYYAAQFFIAISMKSIIKKS